MKLVERVGRIHRGNFCTWLRVEEKIYVLVYIPAADDAPHNENIRAHTQSIGRARERTRAAAR